MEEACAQRAKDAQWKCDHRKNKIAKQNAQGMDRETTRVGRKQAEIYEKTKEVEDIVAHGKDLKLHMKEACAQRAKQETCCI